MTQDREKLKTRIRSIRPPSGIKRRWLFNNVSVVFAAILLVFVTCAIALTGYYYDSINASLRTRATSMANTLSRYMSNSSNEFYLYASQQVRESADADKVELQIIDTYGRVMFSSTGLTAGFIPATEDVSQAIAQQEVIPFTGYDALTGERIMAVTAPVRNQSGTLIGLVRYVSSLRLLDAQLRGLYLAFAAGAGLVMLFIITTNQFFIRSIVNPVLQINDVAKKIANGQYGARLDNVKFDDEIGELCATMNHMSAEIARMEKVKNDFISSVSHELRTPLTAIGGWTETIAAADTDPKLVHDGLAIIQKETARLSQMVEELLDFSRIESGRLKLQTDLFDLRGELYDAVFTYTELLKQEGMKVIYDEPEDPVMINGDKNRLKQVFLNIIDNAAKYGKDGGKIELSIGCKDDFALVAIRDFGAGIPAEELPFVKEKFFKGSARGRGAGIGLAVCTEIVGLHAGELDIDSVCGEGTVVTISLPLWRPPED